MKNREVIESLLSPQFLPRVQQLLSLDTKQAVEQHLAVRDNDFLFAIYTLLTNEISADRYELTNKLFFISSSQTELANWFLGLPEKSSPFNLDHYESSYANQIRHALQNLEPEIQNKVKQALVQALQFICEDLSQMNLSNIEELSFIVAYTRASEAVPSLIKIIDYLIQQPISAKNSLQNQIISILMGFYDERPDEIFSTFNRWLYSDNPNLIFNAGQMMITLSTLDPDQTPAYLDKFLTINAQLKGYWDATMVYLQLGLIDGIGLNKAKKITNFSQGKSQEFLLDAISRYLSEKPTKD